MSDDYNLDDADTGVDESLLPNGEGGGQDFDLDDPEMQKLWNEGKDELEKGEPVGTFRVLVKSAAVGKSNSSGRTQIKYELVVTEGHESAGITLFKYDGLGSAKQVSMTMKQLNNLGVVVPKFNLLPAALLDLQGSVVEVNAKKNGDFYNILFMKRVDAGSAGIAGDTGGLDDEPAF